MQTNIIAGCKVSKQLNGSNIFVVFEGTEQQIMDAYNTLWQVNAIGTNSELEWLNAGQAVAITSEDKMKRGLFFRAFNHLMGDNGACKASKGLKGGFTAQAKALAEEVWAALPLVRVIKPETSLAPYFYRVQNPVTAPEWQTERQEAVVE